MINNQSDKPEKLVPKDSERKELQHPEDMEEAVVKPKDKNYQEESANFGNVAGKKERQDRQRN
jgi:hypothetical protein